VYPAEDSCQAKVVLFYPTSVWSDRWFFIVSVEIVAIIRQRHNTPSTVDSTSIGSDTIVS